MAAGSPVSRVADLRRSTASVPLVGGARLPIAFVVTGLAFLACAAVAMAVNPCLVLLPHVHPHVVALAHAWLPGFLLSVCLGALYQLMPVVLGTPLRATDVSVWAHLGLHATGSGLLTLGFVASRFECVGIGGAAVSAGVALLAVAVAKTFAASNRRDAVAWSFPLAVGWLALTVVLGVLLAFNRRWPFLPLSAFSLLKMHAHLGLAGFFLTMLQGATFQLVPMFTMGQAPRPLFPTAGLILSQAGLLTLAPGLAWSVRPLALTGAVLLAGGVACSGYALAATFRSRRRRVLEPGMHAFVAGAVCLGLSAAVGVGLLLLPDGGSLSGRLPPVYGLLIVAGGLSFTVLGMLCKILPFLVWMRAYGPKVGRQPVPVATSLPSRRLESAWLVLHLAALATLGAALAADQPALATAGSGLLLAGLTAFFANTIRILAHLRPARCELPATPSHPRP